jgi:hypothetical protein
MKIVEQQWSLNDASDNFEDTIASRFERQVTAVPDKLAVVTDEIYNECLEKLSWVADGEQSTLAKRSGSSMCL